MGGMGEMEALRDWERWGTGDRLIHESQQTGFSLMLVIVGMMVYFLLHRRNKMNLD